MPDEHPGSLGLRTPDFLRAMRQRLDQGDRLVVAGLGDSLTYGWMVDKGFFDRFIDSLSAAYPRARLEGVNAGVPGSTAADGLRRLPGVLDRKPDLVIVQFGLNDCFSGMACSAFARSLESIARQTVDRGIQIVLATSCPVLDAEFMSLVEPFYQAINDLAADLGVPAADLANHWRNSRLSGSSSPSGLFQFDGVHPTDLGHEIMAEGLLAWFTG